MDLNLNLTLYLVTYLLSGIPFGYILAKTVAGVDITREGSGNIGATNVLRVLKRKEPALAKKLGLITLILDALKGAVMIAVAMMLETPANVWWTLAVLAVIGHCFSPFMGFEGGKGVATGFGVLAILIPKAALFALAVWIFVAKTTKISSLSSLAALTAIVAGAYLFYPETAKAPIWIICGVVFYKHLPNLLRLLKKEEGKVV